MTRRLPILLTASLVLLLVAPGAAPALDEPARLRLVGERAFADGLHAVARRALERLVAEYPNDPGLPAALLLLGRVRLTLGDAESALEAFRRVQTQPAPGSPLEGKFWEAEALYRLGRFAEARAAYEMVVRTDAASPVAADAFYGLGLAELELKRPEAGVAAFRELIAAWPKHRLAPSATFYLARTLAELKRFNDALPLLAAFETKYPNHKLVPDTQYLLGWARVTSGDAKQGLADLRKFVAAAPNHDLAPPARRMITETLAKYGDRTELQETYKALMEQAPPTPEALYDAGAIAGRLGSPKDQEAAWKRLRKEFPDHPIAQRAALDLAQAAFKRRDWKEAAAQAQAAAKSDEESLRAEALLMQGESELKLNRFSAAAKAFDAVGAVQGVEAGARYRALAGLGLAREQLKELRAALAAYEAVASKSPDATLRDWARDRAAAIKSRMQKPPAATKPVPKPGGGG
jgi:TolA-binding protein